MVSQDNDKAKAPRWEIDSIFPGGSKSPKFADYRKVIAKDLAKLGKTLDKLPRKLDDNSRPKWAKWILDLQELYERLHLASAYCGCLVSQDVNDQEAMRIDAEIDEYYS